jgi:hypothetical protein
MSHRAEPTPSHGPGACPGPLAPLLCHPRGRQPRRELHRLSPCLRIYKIYRILNYSRSFQANPAYLILLILTSCPSPSDFGFRILSQTPPSSQALVSDNAPPAVPSPSHPANPDILSSRGSRQDLQDLQDSKLQSLVSGKSRLSHPVNPDILSFPFGFRTFSSPDFFLALTLTSSAKKLAPVL